MKKTTLTVMAVAAVVLAAAGVRAAQDAAAAPRYKGESLVRPADYRDWVFLSSGLGMEYEPPRTADNGPMFGNVFVNPASYRSFMKTGRWPDKTIFVLEFRASKTEGSINKEGRFQGDIVALEAEVKDARFPDGWAFYNFTRDGKITDVAEPLPLKAGCMECHTKNTAVEKTFVQFYPTLLDVARKMGTVKPGF